ncbi:TetR/AcrR family transcriptional regulator [Streptomyces sp. NP-1717]|uniref:TetR/AcrR family transcriptional regulator n=1 Tax=Streptomyces sp. NP-1717 TaxID=2704470 RepID=UPI001F5D2F70|nr:TetR/AcrR family transcriptional regulator [Streptomyces sp. NP-1717]MCI3223604.1 TetR/AcrR family transcriptional regulator [Streptomyces sp. NP-1717]
MDTNRANQGAKAGYHHGDLRNALITAGVELATDGGPAKVVLREAARRAGVSPTAAYRHFAGQGDLLFAVKIHAQQLLADAMERVAAGLPADDRPGAAAERRLAAIGRGYVGFALEHPGLFRTAFSHAVPGTGEDTGWGGVTPPADNPQYRSYNLLSRALDELVATGRMPAPNRPGAEAAAWSTAHGLAMLLLDGPMARLPAADRDAVIGRTTDTIVAGLLVPRDRPADG